MNTTRMYCNNCGQQGHVFRTCKDPVISCGLLFLRGIYEPLTLPVDPKTVSVLMVRRKDSMSFMEFVRGKYDVSNPEYIKRQLANMTVQEQQLLLEKPFEDLWKKLWGNGKDLDSIEYELARDKFHSLNIKTLISQARSPFQEPEWGFPKGRRMRGETDVQCAIREFQEETNIPQDAYTVTNVSFSETFTGTNNIQYKHIYFVALLKNSKVFNLKDKLTTTQRREISAVGWKTLGECKSITRPHYVQRKAMIADLETMLSLAPK